MLFVFFVCFFNYSHYIYFSIHPLKINETLGIGKLNGIAISGNSQHLVNVIWLAKFVFFFNPIDLCVCMIESLKKPKKLCACCCVAVVMILNFERKLTKFLYFPRIMEHLSEVYKLFGMEMVWWHLIMWRLVTDT